MVNLKKIVYNILSDERITELGLNVLDAYPNEVEVFPTVVFFEVNQNDIEFADNKPLANVCEMEVHIFTKALDGYMTTSEIGLAINEVMQDNFFILSSNREVPDVVDDVRHRVMNFRKAIFP